MHLACARLRVLDHSFAAVDFSISAAHVIKRLARAREITKRGGRTGIAVGLRGDLICGRGSLTPGNSDDSGWGRVVGEETPERSHPRNAAGIKA